jgi:hypothetical protein
MLPAISKDVNETQLMKSICFLCRAGRRDISRQSSYFRVKLHTGYCNFLGMNVVQVHLYKSLGILPSRFPKM